MKEIESERGKLRREREKFKKEWERAPVWEKGINFSGKKSKKIHIEDIKLAIVCINYKSHSSKYNRHQMETKYCAMRM